MKSVESPSTAPQTRVALVTAALARAIMLEVEPGDLVGAYLAERLAAAALTLSRIEPLSPGNPGLVTAAEKSDLAIAQRTWSRALSEWIRWQRHRAALAKKPQKHTVKPEPAANPQPQADLSRPTSASPPRPAGTSPAPPINSTASSTPPANPSALPGPPQSPGAPGLACGKPLSVQATRLGRHPRK
jgi:hypothetical protein